MERVRAETEWAERVGYSRAVRHGDLIEVAGTVGAVDGVPAAGGAYGQAVRAIELIVAAVEALGGARAGIVRTRMFVVDLAENGDGVGRAHGEAFCDGPPTTSMIGVASLLGTGYLVEIEATALVGP